MEQPQSTSPRTAASSFDLSLSGVDSNLDEGSFSQMTAVSFSDLSFNGVDFDLDEGSFKLQRTTTSSFDFSSSGVDSKLDEGSLRQASLSFGSLVNEAVQEHLKTQSFSAEIGPINTIDVSSDSCEEQVKVNRVALDTLVGVLEAMDLYNVEDHEAKQAVVDSLRSYALVYPVHAFAIACRLNMDDVALLAARHAQKLPKLSNKGFSEDMKMISAGAYFRFRQFVAKRPWAGWDNPLGKKAPTSTVLAPPLCCPFEDFLLSTCQTWDIDIIANDGKCIPYSRKYLDEASTIFANRTVDDKDTGRPYISLAETFTSACYLIDFIHHRGHPHVQDFAALKAYVELAHKYGIIYPMTCISKRCLKLPEVKTTPLRVFFYAVSQRWYNEARLIAQFIVRARPQDLDYLYAPEMEMVSAEVYYALLQYNDQCKAAVRTFLDKSPCFILMDSSPMRYLNEVTKNGVRNVIAKIPLHLKEIPELPFTSTRLQFDYKKKDLGKGVDVRDPMLRKH